MSLLHPTVGDMVDRLIVLELKIAVGKEKGKPVAHFEAERTEIDRELDGRMAPSLLSRELERLNAAIWAGIDEIMLTTVTPDNSMRLALLAAYVQKWNAERVRCKGMIDMHFNQFQGEEKL